MTRDARVRFEFSFRLFRSHFCPFTRFYNRRRTKFPNKLLGPIAVLAQICRRRDDQPMNLQRSGDSAVWLCGWPRTERLDQQCDYNNAVDIRALAELEPLL